MKFIKKFNRTKLDKYLIFLFSLSLITYILINFFFINIEEKFKYGYETGQLFSNLSIAFFTSFIFYILTIKVKEIKDEQNIKPYLKSRLIKIKSLYQGLNNTIINSARPDIINLSNHHTKQNYSDYFNRFILQNQNIVILNPFVYDTKIEFTTFVLHQITNINDEIKEIIIVSQTHHSELIKLCTEVLDTELAFFIVNNIYNIQSGLMTFRPSHIEEISLWFEEYGAKINNLTEYIKNL